MNRVLVAVVTSAGLFTLVACGSEEPPQTKAPAPAKQTETKSNAPRPATTSSKNNGQSRPKQSSSDVSDAAINACLSAVKAETKENNVSVLSTEFSQANSMVMIAVGPKKAPWRCLVSNDGKVEEVSFSGSEGKL